MDNPLYDDEIDAYSGNLITTVPIKKARRSGKGKPPPAREPTSFAEWFSRLSVPELFGFGLASGLLLASPLLLPALGLGVLGSVEVVALIFSLPILWWRRNCLRWNLLFRLAMLLVFLGGDMVLAGYLTGQGALADALCVIPQGIAALVALVGLSVRDGRRRAVAEGLDVLFVGAIGNIVAMLIASIVFRAAAVPMIVSGLATGLIGCVIRSVTKGGPGDASAAS